MKFEEKLDEKFEGRKEKRNRYSLWWLIAAVFIAIFAANLIIRFLLPAMASILRSIYLGGPYMIAATGIFIAIIGIIIYILRQRKLNKLKKDMKL